MGGRESSLSDIGQKGAQTTLGMDGTRRNDEDVASVMARGRVQFLADGHKMEMRKLGKSSPAADSRSILEAEATRLSIQYVKLRHHTL